MPMDDASLLTDERGIVLRVVRKINKAEVELAARYCHIISTDKLIEALSFPFITCESHRLISAELDRRLEAH